MATEIKCNEKIRKKYNKQIEKTKIALEKLKKIEEEEKKYKIEEFKRKKEIFHEIECKNCGSIFTYNETEEMYSNWKQCTFDGGEECEVYVKCPHCNKHILIRIKDRYC